MDSDLYFNFHENQRIGMSNKAHSAMKIMTRHHVQKKLYKDMIRKSGCSPGIYNNRCFDGGIANAKPSSESDSSDTGGIFNIDFSPDS